jgi:hypothetical protein
VSTRRPATHTSPWKPLYVQGPNEGRYTRLLGALLWLALLLVLLGIGAH